MSFDYAYSVYYQYSGKAVQRNDPDYPRASQTQHRMNDLIALTLNQG